MSTPDPNDPGDSGLSQDQEREQEQQQGQFIHDLQDTDPVEPMDDDDDDDELGDHSEHAQQQQEQNDGDGDSDEEERAYSVQYLLQRWLAMSAARGISLRELFGADDDDDNDGDNMDTFAPIGSASYSSQHDTKEGKEPDTSRLDGHPFKVQMNQATGNMNTSPYVKNAFHSIRLREAGGFKRLNEYKRNYVHLAQRYIPNCPVSMNHYDYRVFCGQFSQDGSVFCVASQDAHVRLYNTHSDWECFKDIEARNVGWSIVDTDYSPDKRYVIYSTWSPYVQLCNIYGDFELHEPLDFEPEHNRFCLFSVKFTPDSREILGGSSDTNVYLFDIERKQRLLQLKAHSNDVNTVCWADQAGQIFVSGSDDTTCKVWDRRLLSDSKSREQKPVGVFIGHQHGITHVDAKGDGRYFISNGKDQCIKLWDIRKMKDWKPGMDKREGDLAWDYRWRMLPRDMPVDHKIKENDTSIMTYAGGHRVLDTLIRCYFSPLHSTGQRYIYTGSQSGVVHIYDCLTGKVERKLVGHHGNVRDVSWHPDLPILLSASWDCCVGRWEVRQLDK